MCNGDFQFCLIKDIFNVNRAGFKEDRFQARRTDFQKSCSGVLVWVLDAFIVEMWCEGEALGSVRTAEEVHSSLEQH